MTINDSELIDGISAQDAAEQLAAAQEVLRVSEKRYRAAFETSLDAIAICRMGDGIFVDVNSAFFEILGYCRCELVGQTSAEVYTWVDSEGQHYAKEFLDISGKSPQDIDIWENPDDWDRLNAILRQESTCRNFEAKLRKKDGNIIWAQLSASLIELEDVPCVLCVMRDISAVKAAEEEIRSLSYFDPLTGVGNRRLLLERLRQLLAERAVQRRNGSLLAIDLDKFKLINDSLGQAAGDLMLQECARRISGSIPDGGAVARLGGDEFVVIVDRLSAVAEEAAAQSQAIARRLLSAVAQPAIFAGRAGHCTASIGITLFSNAKSCAEDLLQQSNIAMRHAKSAGGNTARFFSPELQAAVSKRIAMEEELRHAIGGDQFVVYYQPQFDHDRLIGAEALVRWKHPQRGLILPAEFIPLAEESGLILQLDDWTLRTTCRHIAAWTRGGRMAKITIAVNISVQQFRQPDFVERVLMTLKQTGLDPSYIELELTENSLIEDMENVIARMSELKVHGFRFALDDFGTGYSSLSYLKRLPLDKLKIDISFVRDILTDTSSSAIAHAIISLCQAMNLAVIAEGVESEGQRQYLEKLGCSCFQGFLFSRPLPADQFELLMSEFSAAGER